MKFNRGLSYDEKIKLWHDWHFKFAWWPTVVEDCYVWLEFYERRITKYSSTWVDETIEWEYRFPVRKDAM